MSEGRSYIVEAPAKINLGLEVIRQRDDWYHDINTLFATINLCDEIELRARDDGAITCAVEGNDALRDEPLKRNLCVKAAQALREEFMLTSGIDITLHKHIPTGAGLGGGSSDAAALLRGAVQLWKKSIEEERLLEIAASLGSDVPFLIRGGVAHGSSRGEMLERFEVELPWHCLIINPGIHIPTSWAYRQVKRTMERRASDLVALLRQGLRDSLSMRRHFANDFEPPVFAAYPEIGAIKEKLYHYGALFALMSGSGSTVFGLFETRAGAEKAEVAFGDYWRRIVRFRSGLLMSPESGVTGKDILFSK